MINIVRSGLAALALSAFALSATAHRRGGGAEGQSYKADAQRRFGSPGHRQQGHRRGLRDLRSRPPRRLSWTGTYSGLTGPVTAAHFHGPAKAGRMPACWSR